MGLAPAFWLYHPDKTMFSPTKQVLEVWRVITETLHFCPMEVRLKLRRTYIDEPHVDLAWGTWCNDFELGLLQA